MTPSATQRGATSLLLVLGLVVLATLASGLASRAVLMDLLTAQARGQSLQAGHAAQAALAAAEADLLLAFGQMPPTDPLTNAPLRTPCPDGFTGPRWQCARLPLAAGSTWGPWRLEADAVRDLVAAPHVWQLHARAQRTPGQGQSGIRSTVIVPVLQPLPADTTQAAVVLNGCYSSSPGSQWQLCPTTSGPSCGGGSTATVVWSHFVPDIDGNGMLSSAERGACLAVPLSSLPAGGVSRGPAALVDRTPCNRATWNSVLGDTTPEQLRAWSDAQAANGLHSLSQPARSIYWIDSPADWTQSLGSPQAPVLLIFSRQACAQRCPRLSSGVQIHGTVFLDAGCDDEKVRGWQAATIDGLLAVEAGLTMVTGSSLIRGQAYARQALDLSWPEGIDPRRVQRVNGSLRSGTP